MKLSRLRVGIALACVAAAALTAIGGASALPPNGPSPTVVISQVYGGGGSTTATSGAPYTTDYVELFNRGATSQSIKDWSVQYASATGTGSFTTTTLPDASIPAGGYYLVAEATGGSVGSPLTGDATGGISMAQGAGKVALVVGTASLGCNGGSTPCTAAQEARIVDLVGYGNANYYETPPANSQAPTLSASTTALRVQHGCADTDRNAADFTAGAPAPRNSGTQPAPCGGVTPTPTNPKGAGAANPATVDAGSTSLLTVAVTGGTNPPSSGVTVAANLTPIGGSAAQAFADNGANGDVQANDGTFSYLATVPLSTTPGTKSLTATIADAQARTATATIALTVAASCGSPYTPIPAIQGSGSGTTMAGSVSTEGVVVGDYEGAQPALRGFYLQDPQGDNDSTTSDGIFVFDNGRDEVHVGDRVRVSGTAGEFEGQTQISAPAGGVKACGTATVPEPTAVQLPVPAGVGDLDYLERFEGMLVRFPQRLYVTEHFQLGRFGQVTLSSGGRLQVPTAIVAPGAAAIAKEAENQRNQIILDDLFNDQNADPIVFGRLGNPLSASNTLRGADSTVGLTGVMTYTWAGNSASGNAYRVRPAGALPSFEPTDPRPASPPAVGGNLKVGAMNLLNFFNTFDGVGTGKPWACAGGVGGAEMDCRGADDAGEFDRQWPKTVAAIKLLNPDVLGIMEIENDGYGPDSAIQFLVDKLNAATSAGKYAFIDADAGTGQVNALGTDAIKVGILYQPARVKPVGATAVLNSDAFVNGGDAFPRNRPSLAQAFQFGNGERFVLDANHLKSKGSACTVPDTGDGQANCAVVRTTSAALLASWLATDPTGAGDSDVLLVGDLNSYAKETPIAALETAGYTNLIAARLGPEAYSYAFDGEWGYLDYALGTSSLTAQVSGVGEWHINADEPAVLDYNDDFKSPGQLSSLYAPDQFRISDHDPVVVGLDLKTTVAGLCRATEDAVTKNDGIANSLCVKLRHGSYGAYRNELRAQSGKALSANDAETLRAFSAELG
jgi:predicted extracellular nuclease